MTLHRYELLLLSKSLTTTVSENIWISILFLCNKTVDNRFLKVKVCNLVISKWMTSLEYPALNHYGLSISMRFLLKPEWWWFALFCLFSLCLEPVWHLYVMFSFFSSWNQCGDGDHSVGSGADGLTVHWRSLNLQSSPKCNLSLKIHGQRLRIEGNCEICSNPFLLTRCFLVNLMLNQTKDWILSY